MRFGAKERQMSTQQIATRLMELCNKGEFEAAQKELFADDAVSIEQHETADFPKETITLSMDVTMKGRGRMKLEEVCVYEVKNGKIASEQFFM
jgi:hypothetical protein